MGELTTRPFAIIPMSSKFLNNKYKPISLDHQFNGGLFQNSSDVQQMARLFVDPKTGDNIVGLVMNSYESTQVTLWMTCNVVIGPIGTIGFKPISRYPLATLSPSQYMCLPVYGQVEYYYYAYLVSNWGETSAYLGYRSELFKKHIESRILLLEELMAEEEDESTGPTVDEFVEETLDEDSSWSWDIDPNKKPN